MVSAKRKKDSVLITGASGRLGQLLAQRLLPTERVIGIDHRPSPKPIKGVEFHEIDIRRRQCENLFRQNQFSAVIHAGRVHNLRVSAEEHHSFNVVGTQTLLDYCHRYAVPKVVVLSSANVYGPRPGNAQYLTEDTPLLGGESFYDIRDLIAVDMYAQSYFGKHPEIETVVLRPVHIVGNVGNAPSNYLRLPRIPTLLGFDPMVQIIHEDDVVTSIHKALLPGIRGVFNVVGPGAVPLSTLIAQTGKPRLPIPHVLLEAGLRLMWRLRLTSFPPPELDHIKFVCMVDGELARNVLRFEPSHSIEETLDYLVEQHRAEEHAREHEDTKA